MVKVRLTRTGRKNRPSYRIVVMDSKSKRDGEFIEKLGFYNPIEDAKKVVYDEDRYKYWVSVGAQPTGAVKKLVSGKYSFKKYNAKGDAAEAAAAKEAPAAN